MVKDALILGAVIVVAALYLRNRSQSATTAPQPSGTIPTPTSISGGALISGGYQNIPPPLSGSAIQGGGVWGAVTAAGYPSYTSPPPLAPPAPPYYGGGSAGLGGPVVAGVSPGTGTTTGGAAIARSGLGHF